jgi:hypothetical protein
LRARLAGSRRLVVIRDPIENTQLSTRFQPGFSTLRTADFAEVLRGVSLTPGTEL